MNQGIIAKKDIKKLLSGLSQGFQVYAPVVRDAVITLAPLHKAEPQLNYRKLDISAKEIFLPQTEVLCQFDKAAAHEVLPSQQKILVFGIRPCDAKALKILDKVFGESIVDPYYIARRSGAVIVSYACANPLQTCFCVSMGGGPAAREGSDVIFFDLGEVFLFEATNEKGEKLMADFASCFQPALQVHIADRDQRVAKAEAMIAKVNSAGIKEKLDAVFNEAVWDKLRRKCLGCGACTFLCPTCHCFCASDEEDGGTLQRVRCWDSCQYAAFNLEASGHNPRPTSRERMRQRIMHKFNYFVMNFGEIACVGCGRCVEKCPVNVDIREIIDTLQGKPQ